MHQGLTIENLSSYMHWGLWWQGSQGQSLIDLPSGNNSAYTLQPEYHAFKHYSAFIHADWRRLQTTTAGNLLTSSYSSADRTQLSIVIVNNDSTSTSVNLNVEDAVVTNGGVYQSTDVLDCAYLGTYSPGDTQHSKRNLGTEEVLYFILFLHQLTTIGSKQNVILVIQDV